METLHLHCTFFVGLFSRNHSGVELRPEYEAGAMFLVVSDTLGVKRARRPTLVYCPRRPPGEFEIWGGPCRACFFSHSCR